MTIKAVVFDIGGVLECVDDQNWQRDWVARWERRAGLPDGHLAAVIDDDRVAVQVATGLISETELRDLYAEALGLSSRDADRFMAEMWDLYCGQLNADMVAFAASLRGRWKTATLSNSADGARREEQRRYGIDDLVDVIDYSHEVGLAKPDPAIYRLTERELGARAHEIIFVDDTAEHIQAATDLGWHGVLHVHASATIRQVTGLLDSA